MNDYGLQRWVLQREVGTSSLPSDRAPGSGCSHGSAQALVRSPKCLPSDPMRSHRPGGEVGTGGSWRPFMLESSVPVQVVWPQGWVPLPVAHPGRESRLGACLSV